MSLSRVVLTLLAVCAAALADPLSTCQFLLTSTACGAGGCYWCGSSCAAYSTSCCYSEHALDQANCLSAAGCSWCPSRISGSVNKNGGPYSVSFPHCSSGTLSCPLNTDKNVTGCYTATDPFNCENSHTGVDGASCVWCGKRGCVNSQKECEVPTLNIELGPCDVFGSIVRFSSSSEFLLDNPTTFTGYNGSFLAFVVQYKPNMTFSNWLTLNMEGQSELFMPESVVLANYSLTGVPSIFRNETGNYWYSDWMLQARDPTGTGVYKVTAWALTKDGFTSTSSIIIDRSNTTTCRPKCSERVISQVIGVAASTFSGADVDGIFCQMTGTSCQFDAYNRVCHDLSQDNSTHFYNGTSYQVSNYSLFWTNNGGSCNPARFTVQWFPNTTGVLDEIALTVVAQNNYLDSSNNIGRQPATLQVTVGDARKRSSDQKLAVVDIPTLGANVLRIAGLKMNIVLEQPVAVTILSDSCIHLKLAVESGTDFLMVSNGDGPMASINGTTPFMVVLPSTCGDGTFNSTVEECDGGVWCTSGCTCPPGFYSTNDSNCAPLGVVDPSCQFVMMNSSTTGTIVAAAHVDFVSKCSDACCANDSCAAFTFTPDAPDAAAGLCQLRSAVGESVACDNCSTGVALRCPSVILNDFTLLPIVAVTAMDPLPKSINTLDLDMHWCARRCCELGTCVAWSFNPVAEPERRCFLVSATDLPAYHTLRALPGAVSGFLDSVNSTAVTPECEVNQSFCHNGVCVYGRHPTSSNASIAGCACQAVDPHGMVSPPFVTLSTSTLESIDPALGPNTDLAITIGVIVPQTNPPRVNIRARMEGVDQTQWMLVDPEKLDIEFTDGCMIRQKLYTVVDYNELQQSQDCAEDRTDPTMYRIKCSLHVTWDEQTALTSPSGKIVGETVWRNASARLQFVLETPLVLNVSTDVEEILKTRALWVIAEKGKAIWHPSYSYDMYINLTTQTETLVYINSDPSQWTFDPSDNVANVELSRYPTDVHNVTRRQRWQLHVTFKAGVCDPSSEWVRAHFYMQHVNSTRFAKSLIIRFTNVENFCSKQVGDVQTPDINCTISPYSTFKPETGLVWRNQYAYIGIALQLKAFGLLYKDADRFTGNVTLVGVEITGDAVRDAYAPLVLASNRSSASDAAKLAWNQLGIETVQCPDKTTGGISMNFSLCYRIMVNGTYFWEELNATIKSMLRLENIPVPATNQGIGRRAATEKAQEPQELSVVAHFFVTSPSAAPARITTPVAQPQQHEPQQAAAAVVASAGLSYPALSAMLLLSAVSGFGITMYIAALRHRRHVSL